jgi:hypothetical protein
MGGITDDVDEFVDVEDDEIEIAVISDNFVAADGDDEFIDVDDIVSGDVYVCRDDSVKRRVIRYDHLGRVISDTKKEPASFRYSRQDGDLSHPVLPNPILETFREYQGAIKKVHGSKLPMYQKRRVVWKLIMKFREEMRLVNIRYRNLHHYLQTYGILPPHKW